MALLIAMTSLIAMALFIAIVAISHLIDTAIV